MYDMMQLDEVKVPTWKERDKFLEEYHREIREKNRLHDWDDWDDDEYDEEYDEEHDEEHDDELDDEHDDELGDELGDSGADQTLSLIHI